MPDTRSNSDERHRTNCQRHRPPAAASHPARISQTHGATADALRPHTIPRSRSTQLLRVDIVGLFPLAHLQGLVERASEDIGRLRLGLRYREGRDEPHGPTPSSSAAAGRVRHTPARGPLSCRANFVELQADHAAHTACAPARRPRPIASMARSRRLAAPIASAFSTSFSSRITAESPPPPRTRSRCPRTCPMLPGGCVSMSSRRDAIAASGKPDARPLAITRISATPSPPLLDE